MANAFTFWHLMVVIAAAMVVVICVLLHYEVFSFLLKFLGKLHGRTRVRVMYLILIIIMLHVVEIWIFGFAYMVLLRWPEFGGLVNLQVDSLPEYIYYSAMVYTTVGFGDIVPQGVIRFLSGTEALTGLVLITWSASFTYFEMQRFWRND